MWRIKRFRHHFRDRLEDSIEVAFGGDRFTNSQYFDFLSSRFDAQELGSGIAPPICSAA
jgi:hypothetical protein